MGENTTGAPALGWMGGGDQAGCGMSPAERDPGFVSSIWTQVSRFFGPGRYFDVSVQGFEGVPDTTCLWVSNHSGGTSIPDMWGFGYAFIEHFGTERALHPLAHDMVFAIPQVGRTFGKMGVLRGSSERAYNTLSTWDRDVMVMPGGDVEVWRPHRDRYKVNFAGRTGYARLALKAGKPVIPVANAGAHDTLWVLTDGQRMARRLHLDELFRAHIFPVSLAFPWGLTIGPIPHIPAPAHLRYNVGRPIMPDPAWVGRDDIPDEVVRALAAQIQGAVQGLLDELALDEPSFQTKVRHMRKTAGEVIRFGRHLARRGRGSSQVAAK